jgi:periplasmic protein TonB
LLTNTIFADSMLETSWAHRSRRSWTTLTSIGLQALALAFLFALPLFRTVGMPTSQVLHTPVSWGAATPTPPPLQHQHVVTLSQSNYVNQLLVAPPSIPRHIAQIDENIAPPQVGYSSGSEIGVAEGPPDGVRGAIGDLATAVIPRLAPQPTIQRTFKTSSMLQGSLIRRVEPVYPPLARNARIQGPVVLEAVIGKNGGMENLRLISGHPMLTQAAIQAVSQWLYKPYILNGEAIEVETQITVNFILGGN